MNEDDTAVAPDDTTVIPDIRPTQVAPALAWSTEEPDTDDTDDTDDLAEGDDDDREIKLSRRHRELLKWLRPDDDVWTDEEDAAYTRGTVTIFVGLIAVAVIATAALVVLWATHRHSDPAPQAAPTTAAPLPPLSTTDAAFLRSLQNSGVNVSTDAEGIDSNIKAAKKICRYLNEGHSQTDAVRLMPEGMPRDQAVAFVGSAVESYCPPPPSEAPAPPSSTAPLRPGIDPVATAEQEGTICGWLRDPSWTMPQIESSTGDMLAAAGWSYTKSDLERVIRGAMTNTCHDVHRSF